MFIQSSVVAQKKNLITKERVKKKKSLCNNINKTQHKFPSLNGEIVHLPQKLHVTVHYHLLLTKNAF